MISFVLGGSGSGKSEFAEGITMKLPSKDKFYIATMQPFDEEAYAKIERHRQMRAHKGFETIECQTNLASVRVPKGSTVLLECISNLVANEMYSEAGAGEATVEAILKGINQLIPQCGNLIIVSNNVFTDGDNYDQDVIRYIDYIARVNNAIAEMSDQVVEVVCGIPIYQKGSSELQ